MRSCEFLTLIILFFRPLLPTPTSSLTTLFTTFRLALPVSVACSSHSLTELMAESFRADILLSTIDHFVQKPLTRDHVMEIVAR